MESICEQVGLIELKGFNGKLITIGLPSKYMLSDGHLRGDCLERLPKGIDCLLKLDKTCGQIKPNFINQLKRNRNNFTIEIEDISK